MLSPASPQARHSYAVLSTLIRTLHTSSPALASTYHPSDFNSPFSSIYEPNNPTTGPLGDPSVFGSPRITPKTLKAHLDQFVVGQERAKKILSVAVYNHYQRIQELQRLADDEAELLRQQLRRESVEGREFAEKEKGKQEPSPDPELTEFRDHAPPRRRRPSDARSTMRRPRLLPDRDRNRVMMEKSNVLLLGPTGVGKTLLAKTLAQALSLPLSISDATALTSAGYIGEDVEVIVQRLLVAANYDVHAAERGIIVLDEVDKIAKGKQTHGKDVGGEGVQQALLKIVEGTTVTVTVKPDRNAASLASKPSSPSAPGSQFPGSGGAGMGTAIPGSPGNGGPPGKPETISLSTAGILFVFCGAFQGIQSLIIDRLAKGSIGFNAPMRPVSPTTDSSSSDSSFSPFSPSQETHFRKSLPFFTPQDPTTTDLAPFNPLDLCEPRDLQTFGLISELTGRIPITVALSALTVPLLLRVLTEPRNSLLSQYTHLFSLSGAELRFTSAALHEVAKTALRMQTGARGIRTVMERLLTEAMFEVPGGSVKYVLVNLKAAKRESEVLYFGRGMGTGFRECYEKEEAEWKAEEEKREARRKGRETNWNKEASDGAVKDAAVENFEEYKENTRAGGAG